MRTDKAKSVPIRTALVRATGEPCSSTSDPERQRQYKGRMIEVWADPETPNPLVFSCDTEWVWPVTDAEKERWKLDPDVHWCVCQHAVEID